MLAAVGRLLVVRGSSWQLPPRQRDDAPAFPCCSPLASRLSLHRRAPLAGCVLAFARFAHLVPDAPTIVSQQQNFGAVEGLAPATTARPAPAPGPYASLSSTASITPTPASPHHTHITHITHMLPRPVGKLHLHPYKLI